jgi:DMSO/TMAO reductase YedYZ molybdopterin-dependent catalytic subunit
MKRTRWLGVLSAGLLAGLVAALVMTLLMAVLRFTLGIPSPSELVGERIVPQLTISQFIGMLERAGGYNQLKQLGVSSVLVGQLVFGAVAGLVYAIIVERGRTRDPERTWRWGISRRGWIVAFSLIALAWSISLAALWPTLGANFRGLPPDQARIVTMLALLAVYSSFALTVAFTYRLLMQPIPVRQPAPVGAHPVGRRAFLAGGAAVVIALATGGILRRLYQLATFAYDGLRYQGPDIKPITPNNQFYSVTKNIIDPSVTKAAWRLEIGGLVAQPRSYSFDDLQTLPATTQETTLMCISNGVGDGLMSNAVWKGVPLRTLLEAADPQPGIRELLLYGADGYTDTFPFEKALELTTLVVYEMNGEPLPEHHGYPVRVIVPGMYGEKNIKWVTRIELIDYDAKGFYEQQGWGPNFVIPIHARFHGPNIDAPLPIDQTTTLIGTAFGGDQGISRVEVSTDDGRTWNEAQITYPGTRLTWVFWTYDWHPTRPGEYRWVVRATDGNGTLQTAEERGITPQGATGYHKMTVEVGM